jgi:YbbR domain-containing protein
VLNAMASGDLRATVDVAGVSTGTVSLQVTVKAPDGVSVKSVQPATVIVTIGGP